MADLSHTVAPIENKQDVSSSHIDSISVNRHPLYKKLPIILITLMILFIIGLTYYFFIFRIQQPDSFSSKEEYSTDTIPKKIFEVVSPDKRFIAFTGGSMTDQSLWLTKADGSDTKKIYSEVGHIAEHITWSQDSSKFFFRSSKEIVDERGNREVRDYSDTKLHVYDVKKERLITIATPEQSQNVFYNPNHPAVWVDNNKIVLVIDSFDKGTFPETQGIWIYSVSSNSSQQLVNIPINPNGVDEYSPDKKYLIFSYFDGDNNPQLESALVELYNGNLYKLPSYISDPSWSPDGKWVAYQDSRSEDQRGLWVTDLRTRQHKRLVNTVGFDATVFRNIQWSSDSKEIIFSRYVLWGNGYPPSMTSAQIAAEESRQGIWRVNLDGANLQMIKDLQQEP